MMCLRPKMCLTDDIINAYLGFLQIVLSIVGRPTVMRSFETHHYQLLSQIQEPYDEERSSWTNDFPMKISEYDKLIFPVYSTARAHWSLAVLFPKEKRVWYLDSMNFDRPKVLEIVAKYYVDEMDWKYGEKVDLTEWELLQRKDIPQQDDNVSCGVFLLKFAKCLCN